MTRQFPRRQLLSNHEQTPPNARTPDAINPPRRKQRDQFSGWVEFRLDHFTNFRESGSRSDLLFDRFVRKMESTDVVRVYRVLIFTYCIAVGLLLRISVTCVSVTGYETFSVFNTRERRQQKTATAKATLLRQS